MLALVASLALLLALLPSTAAAVDMDDWHWSNAYSQWVDDSCGTSQEQFQVVLFDGQNYTGDRTKLCKAWDDFCDVPMTPVNGVILGICTWTANNQVSSFKIKSGAVCIRAFDWQGYVAFAPGWPKSLLGDYPRLNDMGWGDMISSLREC